MITVYQTSFPGANVPKYNIWRQQTGVFQQVAAYDSGGAGLNLTGNDQPEQVQGVHVSANYFSVLGAPVIAGRTFTAAEEDRKSTRLNSSHRCISYAVFCLKKKK